MSQKKKNSFSTSIKMIVFLIIVLLIARVAMIIFGNGKVNAIEGYLYSFASSATEADATSSDATSSDATISDATSCDATSSDATSCNATSSDATSSNVQNSEAIKQQQHLQQIQQVVEEKEEEKTTLKEKVTYRNDELTSKLIAEITESENIKTIIINADDSPKISSDIFKAIQNTDKQLVITYKDNEFVFNGRNIKNPKDIDASISVNSIQTDIDISKIVKSNGIVVSFEPNGELPGVAKIRIKSTDTLKKNIDGNKVYAYYYDEQNKNFILMSEDVKLSEDEYYEFAIEHNSKYILVNEKVDETLLAGYIAPTQNNQKETVSFLESHKAYIMIIGMCILAIVLISVIVIVDKRGIKKRKMMAQQKQNEDERVPKAFSKNNE